MPVRDNTLFEDAEGDTSNGAGTGVFAGRNSQGRIRRALIAFDVAAALPPGVAVASATLSLSASSPSDPVARTVVLHKVLVGWGEGISASAGGGGAGATPNDATWLHTFFPGAFWSAPGGDFAASPSASLVVGGEGTYEWSGAGLTADVLAWVQAPTTQHGWILLGDEGVPGTARRFDSREAIESRRPTLTVHYTESTPAEATSWGRLKTLYR